MRAMVLSELGHSRREVRTVRPPLAAAVDPAPQLDQEHLGGLVFAVLGGLQ
jgi:hypothetical protein